MVWVVAYFVIRFQEQRNLQREINELNDRARKSKHLKRSDFLTAAASGARNGRHAYCLLLLDRFDASSAT